MIRLYRINTGSCGGCDVEIDTAGYADAGLTWADSPFDADVLLLTGPITIGSREAVLKVLREVNDRPLLAIGRCAIDGHPFGRGGVQGVPQIKVHLRLDGCPPAPKEIAAAVRNVVTGEDKPEA